MAKFLTQYVCQQCGVSQPKWSGQCPNCKAWNSLVEEVVERKSKGISQRSKVGSTGTVKLVRMSELQPEKHTVERWGTGLAELDRVLGGGVVPGSVVLVAGEPGIGKSTLLTQLALQAGETKAKEVVYVCGEESPEQIGMRINRLGKHQKASIAFLASTDVDEVVEVAGNEKPGLVVVDSIQTLTTGDLTGMAGSVAQVRETAGRLIALAKSSGAAVFVVGHVTKEGTIAGPKVLEHMVDTVVELTGERTGRFRILRAVKNRFGATDEVGVFSMEEQGMVDVANPSGAFLEESQAGKPGSAVVVVMEGTRPVLVEIQALTVDSQLAIPRRVAQGVSLPKLQLILAVLQRWCRLGVGNKDVFVNVAGGLKIEEPAADLGIALAVASSVLGVALPKQAAVVGEVGLLGEIRRVMGLSRRVKEAQKLGYKQVITPEEFRGVAEAVRDILGKTRG